MTPEPATLRDILVARAAADPDRLAFADDRRSVSYRELMQRAAGQAARLASFGVGSGDRVVLTMSAGVSFAEAFWAAQLLGATTCALYPGAPADTLARRAARVKPRLVVTDGMLDDAPPTRTLPPEPPNGPEDIAILQPTSGTSGEPRAAMIRHRNVLAYLNGLGEVMARRGDVFVAWVPPWHDLGLIRFMVNPVFCCGECHIVEPAVRTIPRWLEIIARKRGTITGGPDFAYRLAARMVDPSTVDLSSLRAASNGAEPVRLSTVEQFESRFGLSAGVVQPGYGLAEATLGVTSHLAGEPLTVDARGNVSNGSYRTGGEVRADGDAFAPGEILVRGGIVFAGYLDAPEATEEVLRDGWLHTGDLGHVDDEGRLYILGRRRVMIKRGGAVVAPREIEEAAQEVDGVRVAAAVGVPDAAGMTEATVVAVEDPRAGSGEAAAVAAAVSRAVRASAGFAPERVLVVPRRAIPRTENGKLRHDRLRELVIDGVIGQAAAPDAPAETR
jgi:fatty-acyl-CoA synthase